VTISTPTPTPPPPQAAPFEVITPARIGQRRALGVLALVALGFLVRLAMPVGIGLFLGALLAFTLEPLYARLRRRNMRAGPAALICALGATLGVAGTALALGTLLVTSGVTLVDTAKVMVAPGGSLRVFVQGTAARLTTFHVNVDEISAKLESEVLSLGTRVAGFAADVAGLTFSVILALFFMTMAAYFVLRRWTELVAKVERVLPLDRRHTHALLDQFRTVGRQVLLGTVVTGLLQGLMAAVGYWVTGVQAPAFFGALTAIASLVPGVGTVLVWASVGAVLLLSGHVGAGLVELTYSALVVGIVADYVIRPRLVGSEKGVPAILMFVALFGGVEVFGIIGLILGPVIATLSLAVLKTYAEEASATPSA
jgi:predicted PurR-regulated permease PerM